MSGDRAVEDSWRTKLEHWDATVERFAQSQPCKTDGCEYTVRRPAHRTEFCPICEDERREPRR